MKRFRFFKDATLCFTAITLCVFMFVSCDSLIDALKDSDDDDDCGDNKYTLYSEIDNGYHVYTEAYCKQIASERGYKCYSYDSTNKYCYGYK